MQIRIAKTLDDVRDVTELTEDKGWEHARKFLAAAPANPFADHLRWMEEDGRPIACVQVFLHQYAIGCAQVGMCLPEYPFVPPELRGHGHFKRLMAGLFDWMGQNGYPLAYDHGRKGLYTGIGFAPCFHHCTVLIRVEDAAKVRVSARAKAATKADVDANADIFRRPFPLGRGLQCRDGRWRPDPRCVRLIRNNGKIDGFVVLGEVLVGRTPTGRGFAAFKPPEGGEALTITDSWATDVTAAAALLRTAAEEARDAGYGWIRINCHRDDPLARVAVLAGGELRWCAAQERDHTEEGEDVDAFYLADLRLAIEQLLPELDARWQRFTGDAPPALRVCMDDEDVALGLDGDATTLPSAPDDAPCIRLSRKAMARAIMGYASPTELSLIHEGCDVPAQCRALADALFVAREPHLIHENMAFAKPHEFGLAP